ncbi:LysR family transcriptional regulator [Ruegeria sp. 2205SS24-7]|uniref:LysR family transcriptional regulator n=1 Tax=Ruegeria discodermiae TaxID=3064389 RepID=UPI002740FB25|nr:LysR family transcriptional regulator [Ruegeria sp. 2205SS24-7]MDP5220577.1 LysR family transcriptional regulator [Ruegeria sp. 2205SS24-7]
MNLKLLEDAIALIECGSLSLAAVRRNVTQPAFSRRIRALEDWVGEPLLKRGSNKIELSEALLAAEPEIRALITRAKKLRVLLTPEGQRQLTVVIATQHALGADEFPRVFGLLADKRPEVAWRVRTLNREDCVALFLRGDADLLLCYEAKGFPSLPFDETVRRQVIGVDTLIPVIGGDLRGIVREDKTLGAKVPVLSYPRESHFGALLEQTGLSDALVQSSTSEREVESAYSVLLRELVLRGSGVAWLPHTMCHKEIETGSLVSLADAYSSVPLEITLFALDTHRTAMSLFKDISLPVST